MNYLLYCWGFCLANGYILSGLGKPASTGLEADEHFQKEKPCSGILLQGLGHFCYAVLGEAFSPKIKLISWGSQFSFTIIKPWFLATII